MPLGTSVSSSTVIEPIPLLPDPVVPDPVVPDPVVPDPVEPDPLVPLIELPELEVSTGWTLVSLYEFGVSPCWRQPVNFIDLPSLLLLRSLWVALVELCAPATITQLAAAAIARAFVIIRFIRWSLLWFGFAHGCPCPESSCMEWAREPRTGRAGARTVIRAGGGARTAAWRGVGVPGSGGTAE